MPEVHYLTADDVLALVEWVFPLLGFQSPILRGNGRALLESAVGRAESAAYYAGADLFAQAAALTNGIALNHPFVDGNKRSAWTVCRAFLRLNGHPIDEEQTLRDLGEWLIEHHGQTDRAAADDALAAWLRARL